MKRAVALLAALVCASAAQAACGGGGYKTPAKESLSAEGDLQVDLPPLALRLNLDTKRVAEITQQVDGMRTVIEQLKVAERVAQAQFSKCTGTCDDERKAWRAALDALTNYHPNEEFDERLARILNKEEMDIYRTELKGSTFSYTSNPKTTSAPAAPATAAAPAAR